MGGFSGSAGNFWAVPVKKLQIFPARFFPVQLENMRAVTLVFPGYPAVVEPW